MKRKLKSEDKTSSDAATRDNEESSTSEKLSNKQHRLEVDKVVDCADSKAEAQSAGTSNNDAVQIAKLSAADVRQLVSVGGFRHRQDSH